MKNLFVLFTLLTVLFVIGCSNGGNGASSDQYKAEEDMVASSMDYMKNLDWQNYSAIMHPMTLERFRTMIMPGIEQKISQSTTDSVNILGFNYSSEELQNMSDSAFFVTMLDMMNQLTPEFALTYQTLEGTVVGTMNEGDSLLHVVVRTKMSFGSQNVDEISVQSLRKSGDKWLLEPSNKIEGIGMIIRQGLGR